jgi:general secretion pathway protein A
MYQNFYSLKKEPFHITPDPEFLFLSPSHKQALGSIIYGVINRKGFVVITGEVGVGKTTILRSYLEGVAKPKTKIIYIFNANVSFKNLLKIIYKELGHDAKSGDSVEMLSDLYQILMEEYKQGNTVLLIVDEAQNMPIETLENLRMLSNLETSKDKLLQIVLIGQVEFEEKLNLYELRQLKQRIVIRSTIVPFSEAESMAYIKHRLAKAANNGSQVFTKAALKRIIKEANGIPRSLNILCDNALITGFGYKVIPVNTKIVNEVITDFNGEAKPSLLTWVIPPAALLLFIVGLFLIYPHKGLIQSRVENLISLYKGLFISKVESPDPSRTTIEIPIKETMKPSVDKAEMSQTERITSAKPKIEPSEEKAVPEPSKTSSPIIRTAKKGDNLFRLTKEVYGHASDRLIAMVQQNNPWIKDIDYLPVGMEIQFPALLEEKAEAKPKVNGKE